VIADFILVMKRLSGAVFLTLVGCASAQHLADPKDFTSNNCRMHFEDGKKEETDAQLDRVSDLFREGCFQEVIQLANFVRTEAHDKFYSLSSEMAEVVTPEGTFSPYILESYERSLLSLLISLSYLDLNRDRDALVELRRTIDDESAKIYNYGSDPVLAVMQAALWDRFDPSVARHLWKRLSEYKNQDVKIVAFAQARLKEIDTGPLTRIAWHIFALGQMPALDWHSSFASSNGPYRIVPTSSFPAACASKNSMLISTISWTDKIATKYDSDYHPLLYAKSLLRLPFGIGYGLVGIGAGAAVGVGGCAVATQAKEAGGPLCSASLQAGGFMIKKSADLVSYTLKPDLRHWKKLPRAILLTREGHDGDDANCACADDFTMLR
jgi:hypothetical protein